MEPRNHTNPNFFYKTVRQVALAGEGPYPASPRPGPSKPSPAGNEVSAPVPSTGEAKASASDFSASKSSRGGPKDIHTTRKIVNQWHQTGSKLISTIKRLLKWAKKGTWYSLNSSLSSSVLTIMKFGWFWTDDIPFTRVSEDHMALRKRRWGSFFESISTRPPNN